MTSNRMQRILQYVVTPVSKNLVCLDLPGEAGPMVDAKEFARLRRLAREYLAQGDRAERAALVQSRAEGDHRYYREIQSLTDSRFYTLTDRAQRAFRRKQAAGAKQAEVAVQIAALVEKSQTLQSLFR